MTDESGAPEPTLRAAAASGVRWAGIAQIGRQVIWLATSVVVSRLIGPEARGVTGLAMAALNLAQLLRDLGTTSALIRTREASARFVASLFWLNVALSAGAALALLALSKPLAWMKFEPRLSAVLPVLALAVLLAGLSSIHQALLERRLEFRTVAFVDISAAVVASAVGISAALAGWSYWAVVAQVLAQALAATLLLWALTRFRPLLVFDLAEIRPVLAFSGSLSASNLLNFVHRNADTFIVGRALGTLSVGVYNNAYSLLLQPLLQIWGTIGRVAYPALVRVKDDLPRFRSIWLRFSGAVAAATFPACLGMAAVAEELVLGLFGPEWSPMIPLVRVFGLLGVVQSMTTLVGTILQAIGRTDVLLKLMVGGVPLLVLSFLAGLPWGVLGVATSYTIMTCLVAVPILVVPFRMVGLNLLDLWLAVRRPLLASVMMCGCVAGTAALLPSSWPALVRLLLLVTEGMVLYATFSWKLNREQARELMALLLRTGG